MDYVTIIEQYVLEAWQNGKTTPEIKQELKAKRWSRQLVEEVIDRLVKQRVMLKEGQLLEINGPDFWSEPTWQVQGKGWAQKKAKMVKEVRENAPVAKGAELNFSAQVTRVPNQVAIEAKVVAPNLAQGPLPAAALVPQVNLPPLRQAGKPPRKREVVKRVQVKRRQTSDNLTLTKQMARLKQEQQKLEEKQSQAMMVILGLVGVIILAALWRIFVIK